MQPVNQVTAVVAFGGAFLRKDISGIAVNPHAEGYAEEFHKKPQPWICFRKRPELL